MSNSAPFRLLPVVIATIVVVGLFKAVLMMGGSASGVGPIDAAVAQEAGDTPELGDADAVDVATGDVEEPLDPEVAEAAPEQEAEADAVPVAFSAAQQEVLQSLQQRREELEQREQELVLKEQLLRAAERQVEQRIEELRAIEAEIDASFGRQEEERRERLQSLVSMYENMKPKDAARIFNRLDLNVLIDVVQQMQSRKVAPILAKMEAAVAQRLTVELAMRAAQAAEVAAAEPGVAELDEP